MPFLGRFSTLCGAGSGLRKYLATTMQVSLFNFIETIMCPVDNRS
jgi:hypothetical protein